MSDAPAVHDEGYDVLGDVHGHADKLHALLATLGYEEDTRDGRWRHPKRRVLFVGDLIDRGPQQLQCVRTARAMVERGDGVVLAGNHEFNALAFATPDQAGGWCRPHSTKNQQQHEAFLAQVGWGSADHEDVLDWFRTLPLWFEDDGLRVVHVCWDPTAMRTIGDEALSDQLVVRASVEGAPEWRAVEHLLKGPEVAVPVPYVDKGGHVRHRARVRWWDPQATTLRRAVVLPEHASTAEGAPYPMLPDDPVELPVPPYADEIPVVFGHYWQTGVPRRAALHAACVDYSAGKGGPLVAYRWSGESEIDDGRFVR